MHEEELKQNESLSMSGQKHPNLELIDQFSPIEKTQHRPVKGDRILIKRNRVHSNTKLVPQYFSLLTSQDVVLDQQQHPTKVGLHSNLKNCDVVEDFPHLKSQNPDKVIELGAQKLKIPNEKIQQLIQLLNAPIRIQALKFNVKINKDCLIEVEVSTNVHINQRKRILLTTQNVKNKENEKCINIEESVGESVVSESNKDGNIEFDKNCNSIKIGLDPVKVRNQWKVISLDFDKIIKHDSNKIKINSISIQAPNSRVNEVQVIIVPEKHARKLKVSSSLSKLLSPSDKVAPQEQEVVTDQQPKLSDLQRVLLQQSNKKKSESRIPSRMRKLYVAQDQPTSQIQSRKHSSNLINEQQLKPSTQRSTSTKPHYNEQINQNNNSSQATPHMRKPPGLPQLNSAHQNFRLNQQQLKELKQPKTAVAASKNIVNFRKQTEDVPLDNSNIKAHGYLQKLQERQKRMEEKYFMKEKQSAPREMVKDPNQQKLILIDKKSMPVNKGNKKIVGTANSTKGFYEIKSPLNLAMKTQQEFDKSCTFSSTLRNFQYKPRFEDQLLEEEDSIHEEIHDENQHEHHQHTDRSTLPKQSENGNDDHHTNRSHMKPPFYQQYHGSHTKQVGVSRDSNLTLNNVTSSTRSTIKTPLFFGSKKLKHLPSNHTEYSANSGEAKNPQRIDSAQQPREQEDILQRYTQQVFPYEEACYEETEEDSSLYAINTTDIKHGVGVVQRRPFSPPFKQLMS